MEGLEQICFRIISAVGMAKSSYVEAMRAAAGGDYELSGQKTVRLMAEENIKMSKRIHELENK